MATDLLRRFVSRGVARGSSTRGPVTLSPVYHDLPQTCTEKWPTGSTTTACRPALSNSSTNTEAVYVLPAPRLDRIAKVWVTASAGMAKSEARCRSVIGTPLVCDSAIMRYCVYSIVREN